MLGRRFGDFVQASERNFVVDVNRQTADRSIVACGFGAPRAIVKIKTVIHQGRNDYSVVLYIYWRRGLVYDIKYTSCIAYMWRLSVIQSENSSALLFTIFRAGFPAFLIAENIYLIIDNWRLDRNSNRGITRAWLFNGLQPSPIKQIQLSNFRQL